MRLLSGAKNLPGLLLLLLFFCSPAQAQSVQREQINRFVSEIIIHTDGSIIVAETIEVVALRNHIKHGIYRNFPTRYKDRMGSNIHVGFRIVELLRDGRPEAYHIKQQNNGIRIYMGSKGVTLQPGTYTYTLKYRTTRQIGFFDSYDELYWNVTGNDWAFPILEAQAIVWLPEGARVLQTAAYTGPVGARGGNYVIGEDDLGNPTFTTTRRLNPGSGLTIAVAWPKGIVVRPTTGERISFYLHDNKSALAALAAIMVVLAYYVATWFKVGKDPQKGSIIPLYAPPKRFTPASARFVMRMGFDQKALAAAIVNMAVNGYLAILANYKGEFQLQKLNSDDSRLSKGERAAALKLFGQGQTLTLKQDNHKQIQAAGKALQKSLKRDYEAYYFIRNAGYFIPGLLLSLVSIVALILMGRDIGAGFFMMVWLSAWTAFCIFLGYALVNAVKTRQLLGIIHASIFALPFWGFEIFGLWAFAGMVSVAAAAALLLLVLINILFYQWLKAPTRAGRRVMDTLEGFKLYMSVAEKDRLQLLNPPDKTPELFEKYLPYAMALDIEQQWNDRFADVLAKAETAEAYSPTWYNGRAPLTDLGPSLGSAFSNAVSASSRAPGSSSGSGGGGSSGGGGGGGGGGGW